MSKTEKKKTRRTGNRNRLLAQVYSTSDNRGKQIFYVRIGSIETETVKHGFALRQVFYSASQADSFADEVEKYLMDSFRAMPLIGFQFLEKNHVKNYRIFKKTS